MEHIYTVTFPGTRDQWEDYLGTLLPIAEGDFESEGEYPMCSHTFTESEKTLVRMGFTAQQIATWHHDLKDSRVAKCDCEVGFNAIINQTVRVKA